MILLPSVGAGSKLTLLQAVLDCGKGATKEHSRNVL
jgi:hypothetical protein